jgi:hypothetical protein
LDFAEVSKEFWTDFTKHFDVDHNGNISKTEFHAMIGSIHTELSNDEIAELVCKISTNGCLIDLIDFHHMNQSLICSSHSLQNALQMRRVRSLSTKFITWLALTVRSFEMMLICSYLSRKADCRMAGI